jgi:hypothetical protein
MSKLAVFLIRLATDPEVRDQFRNPKTRRGLISKFANKNALSKADIDALDKSDVSEILGAIAASNQQTDGTAVRVSQGKRRKAKSKKPGKSKKK